MRTNRLLHCLLRLCPSYHYGVFPATQGVCQAGGLDSQRLVLVPGRRSGHVASRSESLWADASCELAGNCCGILGTACFLGPHGASEILEELGGLLESPFTVRAVIASACLYVISSKPITYYSFRPDLPPANKRPTGASRIPTHSRDRKGTRGKQSKIAQYRSTFPIWFPQKTLKQPS